MNLLAGFLKSEEFTKIGYFNELKAVWAKERFEAFMNAIQKYKFETKPCWIHGFSLKDHRYIPDENYTVSGTATNRDTVLDKCFDTYLNTDCRPEVIVFADDFAACHFIKYAEGKKLNIPQSIGITGFNDIIFEKENIGYPLLTTLRQDFFTIGKLSMQLLSEIISGRKPRQKNFIYLPPELVVRKSALRRSLGLPGYNDIFLNNEIRNFIAEKYHEKNLSRQISAHLGFNHDYFLKKFNRLFQTSYRQYLSNLKLEKAAFYLKHTHKSVTEILFEVGYENHSGFDAVFKKKYGVTPSLYRTG